MNAAASVPRSVAGNAVSGMKAEKRSSKTQCHVKKSNTCGESRKYNADKTVNLIADDMTCVLLTDMVPSNMDAKDQHF